MEDTIFAGHEGVMGRFAVGRRAAYWILDARWAMGRFTMGSDELSAPLVELANWDEVWEGVGA